MIRYVQTTLVMLFVVLIFAGLAYSPTLVFLGLLATFLPVLAWYGHRAMTLYYREQARR